MKKTTAADKYIEQNLLSVNSRYRHTYHAMPPIGWMNDPNGFSYAFGKYHLFYQFYPYAAHWGPMHWGHFTTTDFVKWDLQPVALAPETYYDRFGCFSGSAIVKDGAMYLMYTSVFFRQTQSLARSADGIKFVKIGKVISSKELPRGAGKRDFRDPKVFRNGDDYYSVIGSRHKDGSGQLLLYRSVNLVDWTYVGTALKDMRTDGIYECPDFVTINGRDVLIASPQGFAAQGHMYENVNSTIYIIGSLDYDAGAFSKLYEDELDGGFDFYAPQTLTTADGRVIMIAWMQSWGRNYPTAAHGWAGAMTLPRELSISDGRLIQKPIREIERYRQNGVSYADLTVNGVWTTDELCGTRTEIEFEIEIGGASRAGVEIFKGERNTTKIYYDRALDAVVFDRENSGVYISGDKKEKDASRRYSKPKIKDGKLRMRIFLDVSSAEVFFNDGECVMTGNIYAGAEDNGIALFGEGGTARITFINKYDLIV